ncbi:MAG: nicotinamide-nucleotide amidohydrolase family protein [Candidatus Bipolaricaulota bacterium]
MTENDVRTERSLNAAATVAALLRRGWKAAVAESCTGGGVGEALTSVPGSSAAFLGGVIAYDNAVKTCMLGVPEDVLRREGAVSSPVVAAMATACRGLLHADVAAAVSGIAGPGGGSAEKPVGLVFVGVASPLGVRVEVFRFAGDRAAVRAQAVASALELLRATAESAP